MKQRIHALVSGRVQGVWYRASTLQKARQLGLVGWVRNLVDGRVEFVAEGDTTRLDELVNWSQQGPSAAEVTDLRLTTLAATGEFSAFVQRETV